MDRHDPRLALTGGETGKPIRRGLKGLAQNEKIAARDGRIVGKGQNIDVFIGHCNRHGIRRFGMQRADDDTRAIGHGVEGGGLRLCRLTGCAIDPQVDLDARQIRYRKACRAFQIARQLLLLRARSAMRHQERHGNRSARCRRCTAGIGERYRLTGGQPEGSEDHKEAGEWLADNS